jgi:AraC family transcriptional regulator, regulatory protein of adaptative response / methylated-DNA-[protein]-cysteine methyltransferase
VPLARRGTAFEESVWAWLQTIPAGETRSYAEGAAAVGRPQAVRAIGRANGRNPVAIVVPCHRVIGSDGDLTGYGGGLWRKRVLLDLEASAAKQSSAG